MTEKELRIKTVGNNLKSNILLTFKILFDLIPQVLLVYLISSLITQDTETESVKYIFLAILAKNRTVLVIAHHLRTIQKADQILVFQKGKLLEKGKHRELLEKDGYYKKLWKAQYEV